MARRYPLIAIALLAALTVPATAAAQAPEVEVIADGLAFPTNMAFAPDGRLFFTEKETGQVRLIAADGVLLPEPFASLEVSGQGETGLLGIALHPRFAEGEPWVYLYRSDAGTGMNGVVRLRADGDRAARDLEEIIETVPATNAYHNGGDILFGPDGMLYVSVGEAHESSRAADPNDVGGKVLRLSPEGSPAPGNPLGDANPVYTLGHRNSFGLCFDPSTGDIWETENGPDRDDEVNLLEPGRDYGWPEVTGGSGGRFADPVATFERTVALTGCAWWRGHLYVGSYKDAMVRRVDPDGSLTRVATMPSGVTDLQVGPDGRLWVATSVAILAIDAEVATHTAVPSSRSSPSSAPPLAWAALAGAAVVTLLALVRRRRHVRSGPRPQRDGRFR